MLLIATPAYNSLVHTDYLHTILNLSSYIKFSLLTIGNESLITRARNKAFSIFVHNKQFSHLLFIDADIGIHPQDIVKLLQHNKPIIGAPVPLKSLNKLVYNYGKILDNSDYPLVKTDRIGTAVFMINREVAENLALLAKQNNWVYLGNPFYSEGSNVDIPEYYDVFKVGVYKGEYLSEDYYFCKLCRELGYDIWVDLSIPVKHNGMVGIVGLASHNYNCQHSAEEELKPPNKDIEPPEFDKVIMP